MRLCQRLFARATGRKLFPSTQYAGVIAGFLYVVYSVLNGGDGTNTELVFTPFYLAGAVVLLGSQQGYRLLLSAFVAGVLAGLALQIKYVVLFDIAAFAVVYGVVTMRGNTWSEWRRVIHVSFATGAGILLPTLAVVAWFAAIGKLDFFLASNIVANESLV